MAMFQKILVPTDFEPAAGEALRTAVELAKRFGGTIELIHVYDPFAYAVPDGYPLWTSDQLEALIRTYEQRLDLARHAALDLGASSVSAKLLRGPPALEIVGYARQHGADLIIVGTHGRTGLKHALMGSVAERVVRTSPCPVLAVHASGTAAS